jgi:hypothetical protein
VVAGGPSLAGSGCQLLGAVREAAVGRTGRPALHSGLALSETPVRRAVPRGDTVTGPL